MLPISDFIASIDFDKVESYRINKSPGISCTLKNDRFEILGASGNELPNGILDSRSKLNPTAQLISANSDLDFITRFKNLFVSAPGRTDISEVPLYKNALLLYNKDVLVAGINISFRQGIFSSADGQFLSISPESFENLRSFFYTDLKHDLFEGASYFGSTGHKWKEFSYPNSFYYNPHWNVYETTVNTPILCLNSNSVKLEVETGGQKISAAQLKRIDYVWSYSRELKEKMFEMVLRYYNQSRNDYMLPEINQEIQTLSFFVKLYSIMIPADDQDDIVLEFETWDHEHGLTIHINERNDKMEFSF